MPTLIRSGRYLFPHTMAQGDVQGYISENKSTIGSQASQGCRQEMSCLIHHFLTLWGCRLATGATWITLQVKECVHGLALPSAGWCSGWVPLDVQGISELCSFVLCFLFVCLFSHSHQHISFLLYDTEPSGGLAFLVLWSQLGRGQPHYSVFYTL